MEQGYIHILEAELRRTQQSLVKTRKRCKAAHKKLQNVWCECFASSIADNKKEIRLRCYKHDVATNLINCHVIVKLGYCGAIKPSIGYNTHKWFRLLVDHGYIHEIPGYDCISLKIRIQHADGNGRLQVLSTVSGSIIASWVGMYIHYITLGLGERQLDCEMSHDELDLLLSQILEVGFPISVVETFQ